MRTRSATTPGQAPHDAQARRARLEVQPPKPTPPKSNTHAEPRESRRHSTRRCRAAPRRRCCGVNRRAGEASSRGARHGRAQSANGDGALATPSAPARSAVAAASEAPRPPSGRVRAAGYPGFVPTVLGLGRAASRWLRSSRPAGRPAPPARAGQQRRASTENPLRPSAAAEESSRIASAKPEGAAHTGSPTHRPPFPWHQTRRQAGSSPPGVAQTDASPSTTHTNTNTHLVRPVAGLWPRRGAQADAIPKDKEHTRTWKVLNLRRRRRREQPLAARRLPLRRRRAGERRRRRRAPLDGRAAQLHRGPQQAPVRARRRHGGVRGPGGARRRRPHGGRRRGHAAWRVGAGVLVGGGHGRLPLHGWVSRGRLLLLLLRVVVWVVMVVRRRRRRVGQVRRPPPLSVRLLGKQVPAAACDGRSRRGGWWQRVRVLEVVVR